MNKKLTFTEAIDHLYRYVGTINYDHEAVSAGQSIRYKRKPKKRIRQGCSVSRANDGRPPDTSQKLIGASIARTPYMLAAQARMIINKSADPVGLPTREITSRPLPKIPFVRNRNESCYADVMLFILNQIFTIPIIEKIIQSVRKRAPPNFVVLLDIMELARRNSFEKSWQMMMQYIWRHKSGAKKNVHSTFTVVHHVFLEGETLESQRFYGNITGVSYIKHVHCPACGYWNSIVYNPFIAFSHSALAAMPKGSSYDLQSWLDFRHTSESHISVCVGRNQGGTHLDCGNERTLWYSIIHIGLFLVISLEDYQESTVDPVGKASFQILPHMSIDTLTGTVELDLFAVVTHLNSHWVCRSMLADSFDFVSGLSNVVYLYDDLTGFAQHDSITEHVLKHASTSGLVYINRTICKEEIKVREENMTEVSHAHTFHHDSYSAGAQVTVMDKQDSVRVIGEGTVDRNVRNFVVLKLKSTSVENYNLPEFSRTLQTVSLTSAVNSYVVCSINNIQIRIRHTTSDHDSSLITNKKRDGKEVSKKRPARAMRISSDSDSDIFDIDLQRVLAKSRREARK